MKRIFISSIFAAVFTIINLPNAVASTTPNAKPSMVIYKSPQCSCCKSWMDMAKKHGYKVTLGDNENWNKVKEDAGMTASLISCHTAVIDGYVIEGHVPFAELDKLQKNKPEISGLAVPGMPMNAPGMSAKSKEDYRGFKVLSFNKDGSKMLYRNYK